MTPMQLRLRAWENLRSAKALLKEGHVDNAAYLSGYAVELALKARYCTKNGWADFPDDRAEAKRRGAGYLLTHDLEQLLHLSDSTAIKTASMTHIDWVRVSDWSSEQRYSAVGTLSKPDVESAVGEAQNLFFELVLYEIVEGLVPIEQQYSKEWCPFDLFALVNKLTQADGWEIVMAAWWPKEVDAGQRLADLHARLRERLDADVAEVVKHIAFRSPHDEWVKRFQVYPPAQHSPRYITSHNVVFNRFMPPAFIITNVVRATPERVVENQKEVARAADIVAADAQEPNGR